MSLKDKASKIDFSALVPPAASGDPAEGSNRPRTAPGLMMAQANEQRSELLRENEQLRDKVKDLDVLASRVDELQDELKGWDGAKATRLLDPKVVGRSKWANRDVAHFATTEFQQLKVEIANAGGNIQPVKVRPLPKVDANGVQYEIVFGHRRHQACLELGLPVLALVDNMDERGLFVEMDRENRSRANLSPWEQGCIYRRALDTGLFPSARKLAEAVGADSGNVTRALALASLPPEVVAAFPSPFDLQYRWSKPLADAVAADPEGLIKRASDIASLSPRPAPKAVFDRLTKTSAEPAGKGSPIEIQVAGKPAASLVVDAKGHILVNLRPGALDAARLTELASLLESFLNKKSAKR
ncbi:MAG: ParB/RepB/Spo0J family partition protein [Gammaproteobacteria bacterium]